MSTEAEELQRIISASVRDMLDASRIQAQAGPVTDFDKGMMLVSFFGDTAPRSGRCDRPQRGDADTDSDHGHSPAGIVNISTLRHRPPPLVAPVPVT
jgi:hypothetical protein